MTERPSPVDLALDLFLFAPLGAAVQARKLLPELARTGREHLEQRLPSYRAVGELAVDQLRRRAEDTLGQWGVAAPEASAGDGASTGDGPRQRPDGAGPSQQVPGPASTPPDLPIDGYDELSAVQVLPNLAGLDSTELAAIAAHESANRSRRTILGRIDQLLTEDS